MTKEELEYYKNLIDAKRNSLLKEMDDWKNSHSEESNNADGQYSFHMADQGTDTMDKEYKYYFASLDGELLHELDQALERIENGTYGLCMECNQPISKDRLEAIPHALKCISCKGHEELSR
ncbi:TraR/DksA C4-type zinc finger protein [candidate division KSB1 bacterium]|nr:TraR/DksA C4-type zinc finger protein [candidate division KSB1 bacterium]